MKKLLVIGSILFVMTIATSLMAWGPGRGRAHMMPEQGCRQEGLNTMYDKLNLTADQKARIETLRNAFLRDVKPLQDQMFTKRDELKQLWLQTNPVKENILAAQKDIRAIRDQIQDLAVAHRVDVYNVLTPEQQEKAKTFQGRRGPGQGMRGGMGPKGMMGPCQ